MNWKDKQVLLLNHSCLSVQGWESNWQVTIRKSIKHFFIVLFSCLLICLCLVRSRQSFCITFKDLAHRKTIFTLGQMPKGKNQNKDVERITNKTQWKTSHCSNHKIVLTANPELWSAGAAKIWTTILRSWTMYLLCNKVITMLVKRNPSCWETRRYQGRTALII